MTENHEQRMDWMDNEMVHYVSDEYLAEIQNPKVKCYEFTCPYTGEAYFLIFSCRGFFR